MNSAQVAVSDVATASQYNNIRKDIVQMAGDYATSTGSANAYLLTLSDQFALAAGVVVKFKANFANTGACTLNVTPSGGAATGVKSIKNPDGTELGNNQIPINSIVFCIYDGTQYLLTGRQNLASQTLTDGATISFDPTAAPLADVTLAGNRALANPTSQSKQLFTRLIVYQDANGGRTLSFGSAYQFNGSTPSLSVFPCLADIFDFQSDGTNMYCVALTKGFGATLAYFSGGGTSNTVSATTTSGLDFATDTTAQVTKGVLSTTRDNTGGANSATTGYFSGGGTSNTVFVTTAEGLSFATDTTTQTTRGALTTARGKIGAANSSTVGYFCGGSTGAANATQVVTTDGLTFSTDTTAQVTKGALLTAKAGMGGVNSSTIGYFSGGNTGNVVAVTTTEGLTFASDTTTQVTKGVLSTAKIVLGGAVNSSTIGYFSGGGTTTNDGSSGQVTDTQALTFSTDTTTMVTKGVLSTATGTPAGANSGSYGYFAGGMTGSSVVVAVTNRLDFASDTTTQVTKGALAAALCRLAGVQGSKLGKTQII